MRAVLKAQINKTDRNDARGIAQMMRVGLYRPVHVKTLRSQKLRMLLTHRKLLQAKAIAVENLKNALSQIEADRSNTLVVTSWRMTSSARPSRAKPQQPVIADFCNKIGQ